MVSQTFFFLLFSILKIVLKSGSQICIIKKKIAFEN